MREKLKEKRIINKYTQAELAGILEISRTHYCKIEKGIRNPTLSIAIKIKRTLKYNNDDLFEDIKS
ncbi:MAG: helix-turn-helix transcriptional regulator [Aminipila sp.]